MDSNQLTNRLIELVAERILHDIEKADLVAKAHEKTGEALYVFGVQDTIANIKHIIKTVKTPNK